MTYVEKTPLASGLTFTLGREHHPRRTERGAPASRTRQPCTPPIGGVANPPKSTDVGGYQRELRQPQPGCQRQR